MQYTFDENGRRFTLKILPLNIDFGKSCPSTLCNTLLKYETKKLRLRISQVFRKTKKVFGIIRKGSTS